MDTLNLEKFRYPIGKFLTPVQFSENDIKKWISDIKDLPVNIKKEIIDFNEEMLADTYRPGGWTVRQVVNHIADSHLNAYIRFKLTLTEDTPVIKPYFEDRWADLPEGKNGDPQVSISLLEALHIRWVSTIEDMKQVDFDRDYFHPESQKKFDLKTAIAIYSWHGRHHLEHIRIVKRKFASTHAI